jgi:hypothetical protein
LRGLREHAEASERRQLMPAEILGVVWRDEIRDEPARRRRGV